MFFSDDFGGRLYALNAKSGKELWVRSVSGSDRLSTPAVAEGTVVVTRSNAIALDAKTGKVLWERLTGASGVGPAIANGVVYALNSFGRFSAIDLETGAELKVLLPLGGGRSTPVVADGTVHIATSSAVIAYGVE